MQFLNILALATAAVAIPAAAPAAAPKTPAGFNALHSRQENLCSGLSGTPVCCATDVLGLVVLDCFNPPSVPANTTDFVDICAESGQQARCCTLPILDQALICSEPVGAPGK